jgi:hypothetical protein
MEVQDTIGGEDDPETIPILIAPLILGKIGQGSLYGANRGYGY